MQTDTVRCVLTDLQQPAQKTSPQTARLPSRSHPCRKVTAVSSSNPGSQTPPPPCPRPPAPDGRDVVSHRHFPNSCPESWGQPEKAQGACLTIPQVPLLVSYSGVPASAYVSPRAVPGRCLCQGPPTPEPSQPVPRPGPPTLNRPRPELMSAPLPPPAIPVPP